MHHAWFGTGRQGLTGGVSTQRKKRFTVEKALLSEELRLPKRSHDLLLGAEGVTAPALEESLRNAGVVRKRLECIL